MGSSSAPSSILHSPCNRTFCASSMPSSAPTAPVLVPSSSASYSSSVSENNQHLITSVKPSSSVVSSLIATPSGSMNPSRFREEDMCRVCFDASINCILLRCGMHCVSVSVLAFIFASCFHSLFILFCHPFSDRVFQVICAVASTVRILWMHAPFVANRLLKCCKSSKCESVNQSSDRSRLALSLVLYVMYRSIHMTHSFIGPHSVFSP